MRLQILILYFLFSILIGEEKADFSFSWFWILTYLFSSGLTPLSIWRLGIAPYFLCFYSQLENLQPQMGLYALGFDIWFLVSANNQG